MVKHFLYGSLIYQNPVVAPTYYGTSFCPCVAVIRLRISPGNAAKPTRRERIVGRRLNPDVCVACKRSETWEKPSNLVMGNLSSKFNMVFSIITT